jgi:hypothetical protein
MDGGRMFEQCVIDHSAFRPQCRGRALKIGGVPQNPI